MLKIPKERRDNRLKACSANVMDLGMGVRLSLISRHRILSCEDLHALEERRHREMVCKRAVADRMRRFLWRGRSVLGIL